MADAYHSRQVDPQIPGQGSSFTAVGLESQATAFSYEEDGAIKHLALLPQHNKVSIVMSRDGTVPRNWMLSTNSLSWIHILNPEFISQGAGFIHTQDSKHSCPQQISTNSTGWHNKTHVRLGSFFLQGAKVLKVFVFI